MSVFEIPDRWTEASVESKHIFSGSVNKKSLDKCFVVLERHDYLVDTIYLNIQGFEDLLEVEGDFDPKDSFDREPNPDLVNNL